MNKLKISCMIISERCSKILIRQTFDKLYLVIDEVILRKVFCLVFFGTVRVGEFIIPNLSLSHP